MDAELACEPMAHAWCNRLNLLDWIASASEISLGRALLLAKCFWSESGHILALGHSLCAGVGVSARS